MSQILRQSTQVVVRVGPFMDATDAVTPETTITLAAADQAEALKAAGAATVDISGNTFAAITGAGGWYDLTLTTTDTNTVGTLEIVIQDTSVCLPVFARFQVIEEALFDGIYTGSAAVIPANVTQWLGSAAATPTTAGVPEVDITHWLGTAAATPTVGGVPEVDVTHWRGTAAPAEHTSGYPIVTIKDGTGTGEINTNAGAVALVDTITTYTGNTVQTGDSFARIGLPAGATVSADILVIDNFVDDLESRIGTPSNLGSGATVSANLADIEGQTDDIGAAGAGLTAVPWNAAWDAEVESEVNDALVVHRLDELVNADSDIDGAAPPTVGSVFHELLTKTAGSFTYDQTTDSLEAVRDRGDSAWITAVGFSTHSAADVWASVTRLLTAGTNIVLAKGVGVTGFNDISAANVNTEVLDVLQTDTFAQVGQETPAATQSFLKMIQYLYKAFRNRSTQTATTYNLYNDDATTVDQKSTVSDDAVTFDSGEKASGP